MNIPVDSPLAYIGFLLLVVGGFMVLAGLDVITVQQVSVQKGAKTWVIGLVFAVVGLALLVPELLPVRETAANDTVPEAATTSPDSSPAASTGDSAGRQTVEVAELSDDWRAVAFKVPTGPLWKTPGEGAYTAIGAADTIAWSDETFEGDLELLVDVSSTKRTGEANIVIYGDGEGLAPGCLIFSVANDYQKIMADTVYDTGTYLGDTMMTVDFGEQAEVHTIGIRIAGQTAVLSLDGTEIISAELDQDLARTGRIGLYKYCARPDVTFSNVRVRTAGGE